MTRSRPAGSGLASPESLPTRSTRQTGDAVRVAGPSTQLEISGARTRRGIKTDSSSPQKRPLKVSPPIEPEPVSIPSQPSPRRNKGKGKAVEAQLPLQQASATPPSKRVLPARIRRAAGGGQDGIRDLEDMIVDWLDRFGRPLLMARRTRAMLTLPGYSSDSPPGNTKIVITSLPVDMVHPPIHTVGLHEVSEPVTITPAPQAGPGPSTLQAGSGAGVIETPDWVMVKAGQDDQEEAREELSSRAHISPVRRLRRLSGSEDVSLASFAGCCTNLQHGHGEDTSDEYYLRLHKRYEAIEKRQRKDERDKLAFERYKMRTRIDLLRSMSSPGWSSVVWTVLAREDTTGQWEKGRNTVREKGIEWLRRRLVREGEEVMKRYDQLLPVDPRK